MLGLVTKLWFGKSKLGVPRDTMSMVKLFFDFRDGEIKFRLSRQVKSTILISTFDIKKIPKDHLSLDIYICPGPQRFDLPIFRGARIQTLFQVPGPERKVKSFR